MQKATVNQDRLGAELRTLVDPGRTVVGYENRTRVGIDPVVFEDLGFLEREPVFSVPVTGAESSALGTGWIGSGQDASARRRAWPKRSQRGSAGTLTTAQIKTSGGS
jgi:hypothetical protein